MRHIPVPLAVVGLLASMPACAEVGENREPWCRRTPATILVAQSVPSSEVVPCVRFLPEGWTFATFEASDAGSAFAISGPEETGRTADVRFTERCAGADGRPAPTDEPGTELLRDVRSDDPYRARWTYVTRGGCVQIDVSLPSGAGPDLDPLTIERALSFVPRSELGPPA